VQQLGVHGVRCDELTAIQALERVAPTQPMQPGQPERRAFAYIRHGTVSVISTVAVATGQVIAPAIGPTRTEADVAQHIAQTVDTDPEASWICITDQLNIHQSAALVRLVAERCAITDDVGVKGQPGMLPSMARRAALLSDSTHRIQFGSVPKHTSWLNQVEIGLGILVRRVIRRGNVTSTDDLRAKILACIDDFNQTAKPFRWTYAGRPLMI
jgi:hypothetical protein